MFYVKISICDRFMCIFNPITIQMTLTVSEPFISASLRSQMKHKITTISSAVSASSAEIESSEFPLTKWGRFWVRCTYIWSVFCAMIMVFAAFLLVAIAQLGLVLTAKDKAKDTLWESDSLPQCSTWALLTVPLYELAQMLLYSSFDEKKFIACHFVDVCHSLMLIVSYYFIARANENKVDSLEDFMILGHLVMSFIVFHQSCRKSLITGLILWAYVLCFTSDKVIHVYVGKKQNMLLHNHLMILASFIYIANHMSTPQFAHVAFVAFSLLFVSVLIVIS